MGLIESMGTITTSTQGDQTLTGYLKDEDGNAIANATLTVQSESSSALRASTTNTTKTDSEGKFSLSFKTGSYKVSVKSSAGSSLGIYSVSATNPNIQPVLTVQSGNLTLTINNFNNGAAPLSPSLLTFANSGYTFTSGVPISSITPTVTGTLTSCSARPSLPAGLSLSARCVILGTPTVLQSSIAYLIRGRNSYGDTITKITITINALPPSNLSYAGSPFTFTQGALISTITPSVSGTVTSCSISPNLTTDTGLVFNTTNCAISGTPTILKSATNYTVTASNSSGSTNTTINITVNNAPPSSLSYLGSPFVFTQNTAITSRTPTVSGTITSCSISPNLSTDTGLAFNTTNCVISGIPTIVKSATNYTVTASNSNGSTNTTINITVNIAPPSNLSYSGSPFVFTQNTAISSRTPTVTGTITSCSISPNLTTDTGLTFNTTNCTISGTPTILKTATNYTVTASNSNGSTNTTINITVNIAPPSSLSYSGSPYTFTQNVAITSRTPTVTGTVTSCSISPNIQTDTGLNFNTTNCTISGTPTLVKSATNYTVTASNSNGSTNTTINITVNNAPPSSLSYSGSPYTFTQNTAITSRTPTVTGTVTSCSISPNIQTDTGLNFNTTNCTISGTPTLFKSATNYTITASNSGGNTTTSINITVNIAPPNSLSYSRSPYTLLQGVTISSQTPTYSNTISSCTSNPSLPSGLSISSLCVISGTPTTIQTASNYTITATNSGGSTTASISISVQSPNNYIVSMPTGLLKTGQTTSYATWDDGTYQKGVTRAFTTGGSSGLIWQRCSSGQNNDATCSGSAQTYTWSDANTYCNSIYYGARTWRLPTNQEYFSFIDYSVSTPPTLLSNIFLNTQNTNGYWTNQEFNQDNNLSWFRDFSQGYSFRENKSNLKYVRCVISTTPTSTSYTDNGNGTIVDSSTGLIWQKCLNGQNILNCSGSATATDWLTAISNCESLVISTYQNWRLPNIIELSTIIDYSKNTNPTINSIFSNTNSSAFWSSTTYAQGTTYAWLVNFITGDAGLYLKNQSYYYRCVTEP